MDFEFGKPTQVAQRNHPTVLREYAVFVGLLVLSSLPYAVSVYFLPLETLWFVLFVAYFQVLFSLAKSSGTATSHYLRFLLSGSNPIGMTGASSLLFGAVDAFFDWREDSAQRRQNPLFYWAQCLLKFLLTPIGAVLLLAEFAWDLLMLRTPRLWALKWKELFSLARYHDTICPEKSNDVFYADLAISRYRNDPFHYQWNRMRAMVFELKQYLDDVQEGLGVPESNLFLQSEIAAYQTLKRLRIEEIEFRLRDHYADHLDEFPLPKHLAQRLIKSSRPIHHFETMCRQIGDSVKQVGKGNHFSRSELVNRTLAELLAERYHPEVSVWKVMRLLDSPEPYTPAISHHVTQADLNALCAWEVLDRLSDFEFVFTARFRKDWEVWLNDGYRAVEMQSLSDWQTKPIPDFFVYQQKLYVSRAELGAM